MTDEEKKRREEQELKNYDQLLLALLLLMNPNLDEKSISSTSDVNPIILDKAKYKLDEYLKKESRIADLGDELPIDVAKLKKSEILTAAKEISGVKSRYFEVVTVGDSKTCPNCKKWDGQIISDEDNKYPSYDDFEKSGAAHWGCRCFLKPVTVKTSANNSNQSQDVVFSGFYSAL